MELRATNGKSCVLDAFAWTCYHEYDDLIKRVGHDGAESGFHTQELIEAVAGLGWAVTEIQLHPVAVEPKTLRTRKILFQPNNETRLLRHMMGQRGVLLGLNESQHPHAISWINDLTYDPATGRKYELQLTTSTESSGVLLWHPWFTIAQFLKLSRTI